MYGTLRGCPGFADAAVVNVAVIGGLLYSARQIRNVRCPRKAAHDRPWAPGTFFSHHFLALGTVLTILTPDAIDSYLRSYATMKKAAAIVTNRGGRTCHAAIVSRELGLPAVVGTERGTELLDDGQDVTVSGAEGDTGFVYEGLLDFDVDRQDLRKLERPKTKIMMNVGNPEAAFRLSFVPNDGVGLAREEFIISIYIKVHPWPCSTHSAWRTRPCAPRSIASRRVTTTRHSSSSTSSPQGVGDDRRGVLSQRCHRPHE